jgi:hypothetical protein
MTMEANNVSLEALLRRISRMAEKAFDECGELTMIWLADTPDGQQMIATPMDIRTGMSVPEAKDKLVEHMRRHFKEHGVTRYARAFESWTVKPPPSSEPRPSSELPDDVGTVFVTRVPGSHIAVVGRRGPTGELFVGRVFERKDNKTELPDLLEGVEIVTGPEAERLTAWASFFRPGSLADHPQRREMICIEAADGREYLMAFREIVRPDHGKPYLRKLSEIERPDHVEGRFLNLLPNTSHARAN